MKHILQAEQVIQLVICIIAFNYQSIHIAWWIWPFLFLSPDISMVGYLVNPQIGGFLYNLGHHKAVAGVLAIAGFFLHMPVMLFVGILLWAHSAFDRIMGYGLKYPDSFNHTHLGITGKEKKD